MNQFKFWYKWLLTVSFIMILLGLFIAFFNQTLSFNSLFSDQINPAFWGNDYPHSETIKFQNWIYGVLGTVISGWGIFLAFIVKYPFKERQKWAWLCIAVGITTWFIADTAISIYFDVLFNAVFNAALFLAVSIPLIFTKKFFYKFTAW